MFNFLPVAFHMFVNISSLLIPCLLNVSLLIAMQLIFPEDISQVPIVHGIPTVKTDMTNRSVLMAMEIKNVPGCLAAQ